MIAMTERKANLLETVIEEIGGETGEKSRGRVGKLNSKNDMGPLNNNPKGQKNGKNRHTKNVVVKLPTANKRADDENKEFPKGTETMRQKLEEIKEESRENKLETEKENESSENIDNINQTTTEKNAQTSTVLTELIDKHKIEVTIEDGTKELKDPIYGMFTRTNTERSLLSNRSDSVAFSLPMKRNRRKESVLRPKSSHGWSKKDLDLFLPRKSFFGVHDNTLASAGFDVRSDEERKRPDWRQILKMHTEEELHPPQIKKEEKTPLTMFGMMDDDSGDEAFGLENIETAIGSKDPTSGNKGKKKHGSKKVVGTEKEEYKPLYDYLKYIADNPEEYVQSAKYSAKNTDHKHPSNLVRLGRAFRRGHHGAVRNNIFLHAISGLKSKSSETGSQQRSTRNEKGGTKKETDGTDPSSAQDETEIEKLKTKAEKWMRNLTTQQYLKAKEQALKDVGEEDMNMSKWWLAFRSCHYLRVPPYMSE
ncbi:uncharacterized protein LOC123538481 [Mercenaria mercenaria]|uniref:uncharacterized protein LOC123538481 n=1 Tax=Mercenaria mercenaria TaxID=6596 RepID=UPI00234E4EF3|nr:uncharacterized protein LOC123538481 [Mercenaria mercenaria]